MLLWGWGERFDWIICSFEPRKAGILKDLIRWFHKQSGHRWSVFSLACELVSFWELWDHASFLGSLKARELVKAGRLTFLARSAGMRDGVFGTLPP